MSELERLGTVQVADVYKGDRLAARLERTPSGTVLRYLDAYDGPPVARSLPVGGEVRGSAGSVPAFFANLLPEGRRLTALQRGAKTSADDELTLLLAVDQNTRSRLARVLAARRRSLEA